MAVRCLQATAVGIYLPVKVEVALSQDGKQFQPVQRKRKATFSRRNLGPWSGVSAQELKPQLARFIRVRAVNVGIIPAGLPAAGRKAWLFIDEILVNP